MAKKIFKSILSLSVAVLLICVFSIFCVFYGCLEGMIKDSLKNEAHLIAQQVEYDESYLDDISFMKHRVTLIDTDGGVLYDSQADENTMDSHYMREEVVAAKETGEAFVTRYSDTISTETIYYALELDDGRILRVAQQQSAVLMMVKEAVEPVVLIMIALVIMAWIISIMSAKRIVKPINEIDLSSISPEEPYPELAPLIGKIRQQNLRINMHMEELRKQQKEFTAITENMREGFLLIDKKQEILSYNSPVLKLLGESDDIAPHTAFELNRSREFRTAVEEAIAGNFSQQIWEKGEHCYSIIADPVIDHEDVAGAVIIIIDVTEKEQRDKLRREFTSNVSHELKTPLTTIYGVSDMMAEGIIKNEDIEKFAVSIRDEAERMITLINDIMKLSKLDENVSDDETVDVELMEMTQKVMARLSLAAKEKDVRLELGGQPAVIKSIPALCEEIIYNLCENAIKYNKPGGLVHIDITEDDSAAILTVEDTGKGIPADARERIFERFFRVDKSRNCDIEGTGLGLSIVKHAVTRLGGTISVESTEGVGTKMTVRFPA